MLHAAIFHDGDTVHSVHTSDFMINHLAVSTENQDLEVSVICIDCEFCDAMQLQENLTMQDGKPVYTGEAACMCLKECCAPCVETIQNSVEPIAGVGGEPLFTPEDLANIQAQLNAA